MKRSDLIFPRPPELQAAASELLLLAFMPRFMTLAFQLRQPRVAWVSGIVFRPQALVEHRGAVGTERAGVSAIEA